MTKVLIIDDERTIREGLKLALELDGKAVETACDGAEGLSRIGEQSFDVILVDVTMPVMGGMEMAERLRSQGSEIPLILCSAHFGPEAMDFVERHENMTFLKKPMTPQQVRQEVNQAVKQN